MRVAVVEMSREPQTILIALLSVRGYRVQHVVAKSGLVWNTVRDVLTGQTMSPDPDTIRRITAAVNELLGTAYTSEEVLIRTRDRVTGDVRRIEKGLRGEQPRSA